MKNNFFKNDTVPLLIYGFSLVILLGCLTMYTNYISVKIVVPAITAIITVAVVVMVGKRNIVRTIKIKNKFTPILFVMLPVIIMNLVVYAFNPMAVKQMAFATIWTAIVSVLMGPVVFWKVKNL